jgi:hypothetical protein
MLRITLLTALFLGLLDAANAQDLTLPKSDLLKSPPTQGRYQIVMSPHVARDTFLLDTETGRVWQLTAFMFLNGEPAVWNLMPRIDNLEDHQRVVNDHGRKSPPATAKKLPPISPPQSN